jgi:phosphoribosyl 1,2-cyclic phosphodiesterase
VRVTIWGSRGSIASAGPETVRYGGNTACVQVSDGPGAILLLDAGTGLRRAGVALAATEGAVHVLLTHLHMDHIQGLGFFRPLFQPGRELHLWGPPSTTLDLRARLTRYLSPPLFPVRLRDLPSSVELHDVPTGPWQIGPFTVHAATVVHPGPTVGYRIERNGAALAYLPDHEPALGGLSGRRERRDGKPASEPAWTSGYSLAAGADLLLHDAQYTPAEYEERVGWGHSSVRHAVAFADLAGVKRVALFHHDPDHDDDALDRLMSDARSLARSAEVVPGCEDAELEIG